MELFWAAEERAVVAATRSTPDGLTSSEAEARLAARGPNPSARTPAWHLVRRQLSNPIVLLLVTATVLSMALGDAIDGVIILVITVASGVLGYVQERGAVRTVEDLLASVRVHITVRRDGRETDVLLDDVVPGDVVEVRAGDVIPADGRVLAADALLVDEAALTGESFPVDKQPGVLDAATALRDRTNAVWRGTHVASGTGRMLAVHTGADTELGKVRGHLALGQVPTAFEAGLRRFGILLMRASAVLVVSIFVVNLALDRPVIDSLLFSLALAVGLTPQLLPAIVTVTLSHGARVMARRRVVVKRLDAIEDIGSIDVLCTDKTGTLTTGAVHLDRCLDPLGAPSDEVRHLAWLNAFHQHGFANAIDDAILSAADGTEEPGVLVDELPYDFTRRMLSVLVERDGAALLVTKGAVDAVLAHCTSSPLAEADARRRFSDFSAQGYRVLAVATRSFAPGEVLTLGPAHEASLRLAGFLCFADPPKPDAAAALDELRALGVTTKLITGDNRFAARHAAGSVGMDVSEIVVGAAITAMDDAGLRTAVERATVFAEVEPLQKERIVAALRAAGHTVGYLGDGINDAPSLRSADVGISVESAVDIARHTASVVLLDKGLDVLAEGIRQGRRVFANTLKYVRVTISANFGNMVSMAVAAAVLPFLPLLPRQILLLNFLSDIPGTTIAADRVDPDAVADPHGWDIARLRRFTIVFGLISSVFDLTTFAILRLGFDTAAVPFRTGWFIESTATELAVMLVLRTQLPFFRSRPGAALLWSSVAVAVLTVALPFTPLADPLGLDGPSPGVLAALAGVTAGYVAVTELAKRRMPFTGRATGR